MTKVAVIGAGLWAPASRHFRTQSADHDLGPRAGRARAVNDRHENPLFLADVRLQSQLSASDDLAEVLDGADLVVVGRRPPP